MDLYEAGSHSFIIRIWMEEIVEEMGRATWRGHITHVASGDRRYFEDLDGVVRFIGTYLESMNSRLSKDP